MTLDYQHQMQLKAFSSVLGQVTVRAKELDNESDLHTVVIILLETADKIVKSESWKEEDTKTEDVEEVIKYLTAFLEPTQTVKEMLKMTPRTGVEVDNELIDPADLEEEDNGEDDQEDDWYGKEDDDTGDDD